MIHLTLIVFIACLTVLMRESMLATAKQKTQEKEILTNWSPCKNAHDFVVIDSKLVDGPHFAIRHTCALYRCSRCKAHASFLYPGEWTIADLLQGNSSEAIAKL